MLFFSFFISFSMSFHYQDIKWIKSVTRSKGAEWAYMEFKPGDIFPLSFSKNPKWYPTNYKKALPGDLMVLFQTLQPDQTWYITHLVAPVDHEIFKDNSHGTHPYKRMVMLIGKTEPAYKVNPNQLSLFKCNRGQICDIRTLEKRGVPDWEREYKQRMVWDMFKINSSPLDEVVEFISTPLDDEDEGELEGAERSILRAHKYYERSQNAVKKAKALARKLGIYQCQACSFNFESTYPGVGNGFIECHHNIHLSTGIIRITTSKDLSLVCSNCHRMLHRKFEGKYLTVDELKQKYFPDK